MQVCGHCKRIIMATVSDPAIAASSLGGGSFHGRCAGELWQKQASDLASRKEASSARRSEIMKARHASLDAVRGNGDRDRTDASTWKRTKRRRGDGDEYRLPAEES